MKRKNLEKNESGYPKICTCGNLINGRKCFYCKECRSIFYYRRISGYGKREIKVNNNTQINNRIDYIVRKILKENMEVSLYDINEIITLYQLIMVDKKYGIDQYRSGRQINIMFQKLLEYNIKNKKING